MFTHPEALITLAHQHQADLIAEARGASLARCARRGRAAGRLARRSAGAGHPAGDDQPSGMVGHRR